MKNDYLYSNWFLRFVTILLPIALWILWSAQTGGIDLATIPGLDLLLLGLASFRVTRLLSLDTIAEFFRGPFVTERSHRTSLGVFKIDQEARNENLLQRHVGEIISCYWCLGIWVSLGLVAAYLYIPRGIFLPFLLFLSVAGSQAIFESLNRGLMQAVRWFNREPKEAEETMTQKQHHEHH